MNKNIMRLHTVQHRLKPAYAAALLALAIQTAQANPTDGTVMNGQASFATSGNTLTVTNTPGTIINWQGFSIGANETTRFVQESASSTVLNRVISNNPSSILGTLQSNGRVFLINPNGIIFGAGATVDVAGMVASTLNLSNADFLAGHNHFTAVPNAGNVSNAGNISAQDGGQIYLIAPNVGNTGVITAPNGEILLAAGASVDLVSTNNPNLRVSITAPAGDATNVGQLIASSGSLGLFGTVVRNSGTVSADSATLQGGRIVFKASQRTEVSGNVSATGVQGGEIQILGKQVALTGNANVDASGVNGGGAVLIGGDAHGANAAVPNAQQTYIASTVHVNADASQTGNGGKVVVWADNATQFNGNISARGGAVSGNGGWVEVSGKQKLSYAGMTSTLAVKGITGTLLLDPFDFIIAAIGGDMTGAILSSQLGLASVTITTGSGGMGTTGTQGNIIINDTVTKTTGPAVTLTLNSFNNIAINAPVTSTVGALNIALNPGIMQTGTIQTATISANVDTLGGTLSVAGSNLLIINAGTTTLNSANTFNNLTLSGTGTLTGTGAITINNTSGGINAGVFNWTGGTLSGTGTFTTTPGSSPLAGFQPTATTMNGTLTLSRPFFNKGVMSQGAGALILTVTPQGALNNIPTAGVSGGTLVLGNGAAGGILIVNGILSNLGGMGTSGTGISSVDATGATIGTITNNGSVGVAAGSTLNWTAGVAQTNTGTWAIGSTATPAANTGVLNLGVAAGGGAQAYSGGFTNVGTVNVNSGINTITGAFTNNGTLQFGTLAAGTNSYNGAYSEAQLAGGFAPSIIFTSGTNTFNSTVAVPSIWTLYSNGGFNTFDTTSTITNLALGAGSTLTGLGNLTVPTTGGFNWNGGTLATTGTGVNAATITLNNSTTPTTLMQGALNLNRALINNGVVSQQSVNSALATTLNIGAGGSFINNGTFNMGNTVAGPLAVNVSDTGTFTNGAAGIINSAGAVNNAIQATLGLTTIGTITNSGAINAAAGNTLNYLSGQSATNAGTFTTVAGGVLNLGSAAGASAASVYTGIITNNGTLTVVSGTLGPLVNNGTVTFSSSSGGYSGAYSGTGALILSPGGGAFSFAPALAGGYVFPLVTYNNLGTLNFDVNATITKLDLLGSSFRGAGAITIPNGGTLTVNGTTLGGFSALTVNSGATANFSNAAIYRPVINSGTMNVAGISTISTVPSASGSNNGSLTNGLTGVLNLNNGYLQPQSGGSFTNNGMVVAQSGFNTINASGLSFSPTQVGTITNNGSIIVNPGATLAITNGLASTNSGVFETAAAAAQNAGGAMTFSTASGAPASAIYTYSGSLINKGSMDFLGAGNVVMGTLTQSGILNIASGVTLAAPGFTNTGTLMGGGTLNLGTGTLTNSGIIAPNGIDSTTGAFTLAGNLMMGTGGSLNLDINSAAAGSYDTLSVSGTANLTKGTLNLSGTGTTGSYTVVTAAGGLGGTRFAAINSVGFTQTPAYFLSSLTLESPALPVAGAEPLTTSLLSELVSQTTMVSDDHKEPAAQVVAVNSEILPVAVNMQALPMCN